MIICPKCGTTNEDGAEFCKACEAPLAVAEQPAKKPGIPRWILVVCGVFVVLGVLLQIFDRDDSNSTPRSNTADVQSSAPAETGASSRAETSRAEEDSQAQKYIAAVKAKYKALLNTELNEISSDYDESDGSTVHLLQSGELKVCMMERNNTITLIQTSYARKGIDLLIDTAKNDEEKIVYQSALLNSLYCPIAVYEDSINSKEDLALFILYHMETDENGVQLINGNGYKAGNFTQEGSDYYSAIIAIS